MAAPQSVSVLFQPIGLAITARLSGLDSGVFDNAGRRLIRQLRQAVGEIRLDLRDYEYADTRHEALAHARSARTSLAALRSLVLAAGDAGIFGAADIAQLTAGFDSISDGLQ